MLTPEEKRRLEIIQKIKILVSKNDEVEEYIEKSKYYVSNMGYIKLYEDFRTENPDWKSCEVFDKIYGICKNSVSC